MNKAETIFTEGRHKAHVLHVDKNFLILDWRREDGGNVYAVRYCLDKEAGTLTITGDTGCAVACWDGRLEEEQLVPLLADTGYFLSKVRCMADMDAETANTYAQIWTTGFRMAMDQLRPDDLHPTQKIVIHLDENTDLVAEEGIDRDYKEIYLGIQKDGIWEQDLAFVREAYDIRKDTPRIPGVYEVAVYADPYDEDYTDIRKIREFREEEAE